MDRLRHISDKDKHEKYIDKDKCNTIVTDIKNIKIKEILRTVKMNSSMRIKAPKGKKVMENKDFIDDLNGDNSNVDGEETGHEISNFHVNVDNVSEISITRDNNKTNNSSETNQEKRDDEGDKSNISEYHDPETNSNSVDNKTNDIPNQVPPEENLQEITSDKEHAKKGLTRNDSALFRDRKLSLDYTLLARREGISQSEFDLHTIGKSPLERKSSFFRKRMDNFLKNTTEIFRRHSSHYKTQPGVQRRGSISVSLQSLHEDSSMDGGFLDRQDLATADSVSSLKSTSLLGLGDSNMSVDQDSIRLREMVSSQPMLCVSQPIIGSREHMNSLSAEYTQESLLNSRAISMSSGLVSSLGRRRNSRSKRVTWLGNEGLNNYLRQEQEESTNIQGTSSYQDLRNMKDSNLHLNNMDTKGRRLSYQRAVSGEDPVRPKYNVLRKKNEPQRTDLLEFLEQYNVGGLNNIPSYNPPEISPQGQLFLKWAKVPDSVEIFFEWKLRGAIGPPPPTFVPELDSMSFFHCPYKTPLVKKEEDRQAVIRELFVTEAAFISQLSAVVKVFIGTAYFLQNNGYLPDLIVNELFLNLPELLNASLVFWDQTLVPMIVDGVENNIPFNSDYMAPGFSRFSETLLPFEHYVEEQPQALEYFHELNNDPEASKYFTWCHKQKKCKRLQLGDFLVAPMQRLTKYGLILRRLISVTEFEPERTTLIAMESNVSKYVRDMNRSVRQRQEMDKIFRLCDVVESYQIDFKDEDLDRAYRMHAHVFLDEPMRDSHPDHGRSIIHQGDYRFKDNLKEMEVHIILLTDMLLICKRCTRNQHLWKMVRPKMMVERLILYTKYSPKHSKELLSLIFIGVDDVGSSCCGFVLTELKEKEPNPRNSLKFFEKKFREAKLSYEFGVWSARNSFNDKNELNVSLLSLSQSLRTRSTDDSYIERLARERVVAMIPRTSRASRANSTDNEDTQMSLTTESFDADGSRAKGARQQYGRRHPMQRRSTGSSSRNSRLSSFQQSTSASHEEPQPGPSTSRDYSRAGSSMERYSGKIPEEGQGTATVTVNVDDFGSDDEEYMIDYMPSPPPPPSLQNMYGTKTNTLYVQPQSGVMALVHSLPELSLHAHGQCQGQCQNKNQNQSQDESQAQNQGQSQGQRHRQSQDQSQYSYNLGSDSNSENRRKIRQLPRQGQQAQSYLQPDRRGSSYPPPSPSRASLKRGMAFSDTSKHPPLAKMEHVHSQSVQVVVHEETPGTSRSPVPTNPTPPPLVRQPSELRQTAASRRMSLERRDRESEH